MDDLGLTDITDNADGTQTLYYDDGSQITIDANGNPTLFGAPGSGTGSVVTDSYGIQTTTWSDGTQTFKDSAGNDITLQQAASIANNSYAAQIYNKAASVAGANGGILNSDGSINVGNILTPAQKANIISQLGNVGGQWLAKTIGGSTVFYRKQNGMFGTLDVKSLLIPGAIIAALVLSN